MSDLKDEELIANFFNKSSDDIITETTLILDRKSLTLHNKDLPIEDIQFYHFKMTMNELCKYGIIMFVDNDNKTRILKNKYSNSGI